MRIDRLRHLAVIDPDTACCAGTVVDYWVNPRAGRVAALAMRPVDIDQTQRVSSTRVARIGQHAVMLGRTASEAPQKVEAIPEDWLDRRHLTSLVVYTDGGECLGRVAGAQIDPVSLEIQSYELAAPFWRRWILRLPIITGTRVAWCGRDVLVVRTAEPAKLRPVGREDGDYASELAARNPERTSRREGPRSVAV